MLKFARLGAIAMLCAASALSLTACSTTGTGDSFSGDETTAEGKLLGDYLAGRYAYHIDDNPSRLAYYTSAFQREPDSAVLGAKAVNAAISSGDVRTAKSLALKVTAIDPDEPLSRLVLGALDIKSGKNASAVERLTKQPSDPALGVMMAMMEAWALYGDGQTDNALELFDSVEVGGYFDVIATLQKAKIYAETGQGDKAKDAFARVKATGVSPISMALARAQFQATSGDLNAALTDLQTFDEEVLGGAESGPIRSALDSFAAGNIPVFKSDAAHYASESLVDPAGEFFYQQRQYDIAEIYLRMAVMLDPDNHRARLWLGAALERMDRLADAETVYQQVPDSSDYIVSAQLAYANLLMRNDEDKKAEAVLRKLNKNHETFLTREAIGINYLIAEDYEKALPYFDAMVESMSEEELNDNSTPLFHRGVCLSELGRFEESVVDFKRVLEINPDSADALNYLGYTWVDRGENLTEAFDMIRKAVKLQPDSGAIVDSLGWAHYKLGQYSEARIHLEDAVSKSPDSATIIDHLGDVYWRLGRFREAGFQWERALDFDPTDKERARIKAKLKGGLEAAKDMP